ncbi:phosphoserine transaminase [uncultured Propionibacterium sp.]|uniref:phosphoserine transaminase n=1 Tax=uncultured Propionibacterium sp. TaxID=218066 RepID=UPI002931F453|nr:phosphoserine transaminase [uncultured Propionibacterium sp.]
MNELVIPAGLLPEDGRFGSGPAKVRPEALAALVSSPLMGTSHRRPAVRNVVARVRERLAELYSMPDGHQVVLGNGGATSFWDLACTSLIERRSSHAVYGSFSRRFAAVTSRTPWLQAPAIAEAPFGSGRLPAVEDGIDAYAWAQNETSTGVAMPVERLSGTDDGALMLVDATSAAGGIDADLTQVDALYFSPQKNFSSDGGLWLSFCSPAALERSERLTGDHDGRWVPDTLNLTLAATSSAKDQTLNTPALATLVLLDEQLGWMLDNGGMEFVTSRTADSSNRVYRWAEANPFARPFVADPALRSPVVATIAFDERVDAPLLCSTLRTNGILDIEPYRALGTDQMRIGVFASVEPDDVSRLLDCIDWVLERIVDRHR